MTETLSVQTDPEGVGLAAPQVGQDIGLFIIKYSKRAKALAFINPIILEIEKDTPKKGGKKDKTSLEGCLSIDKIWSPVRRPGRIHLQYMDETGVEKKEWFDGFKAIIIQHEIDHLHGILFTQRAVEQNKILYKETDGELSPIQLI